MRPRQVQTSLQRSRQPSAWNLSEIVADQPKGSFQKLSPLVRAIGLTYNSTPPERRVELEGWTEATL